MTETSPPTSTGQDTIPSRKHPLARCEDCGLNDPDNAFVPSHGPEGARLAIIGEAPGFQEGQTGIPFTGPSGKLLDVVLKHHGIDRGLVWLSNTCLCRPPDNRTPTASEIACCAPRLKAELGELQPEQIVTLGGPASQVVLGTRESITRLRVGPPRSGPQYSPASEVIPTFHPAYCLRDANQFPHLLNDIGKLRRDLRVNWEPPVYKVFDDPDSARQVLDILHRRGDPELTIDIETGLEKDFDYAHLEEHKFLCVGLGYELGRVATLGEKALRHPEIQQSLGRLLKTTGTVAHNGKFDLGALARWGRGTLAFDTMLASYCLDETQGTHGLKYLAVELLGAPPYDREVTRYVGKGDSYAVVPRDILYRYNAFDVACTQMLRQRYERELADNDLGGLNDFLTTASGALQDIESRGLRVDESYLDYLTDHYLEGLGDLERELRTWVDNPRSPVQVRAALAELGWKVDTTNVDQLEAIAESSNTSEEAVRFVTLMLQHRKEQKLYGTYVKGTRKRLYHGAVFPTFLLHGTVTGRLSCRNPNLQNVPRDSSIRRLFVPAPGNVFVQADYATIELRVLATLAEDKYLRQLFIDGRDIHDEFSRILYGDGFTKEQRVRTKAFVYGTAYGREPFSIASEYNIPLHEASAAQAKFTRAIPDVMRFRRKVKNQVLHEDEDLITPFGRHRRVHLVTNENKKDLVKEAYAFYPQSTASDINLHAGIRLNNLGYDVRVLVHDSILVECAASDADAVAFDVKSVMERTAAEVFSDYVPFPVEVKIGSNWGEV